MGVPIFVITPLQKHRNHVLFRGPFILPKEVVVQLIGIIFRYKKDRYPSG